MHTIEMYLPFFIYFYKLDYYDVSLEILAVYLQSHPDSAIAINLKGKKHWSQISIPSTLL